MGEIIINNRIFEYVRLEKDYGVIELELKIDELGYRLIKELEHEIKFSQDKLRGEFGNHIVYLLDKKSFEGEIRFNSVCIYDKTFEIRIKMTVDHNIDIKPTLRQSV